MRSLCSRYRFAYSTKMLVKFAIPYFYVFILANNNKFYRITFVKMVDTISRKKSNLSGCSKLAPMSGGCIGFKHSLGSCFVNEHIPGRKHEIFLNFEKFSCRTHIIRKPEGHEIHVQFLCATP